MLHNLLQKKRISGPWSVLTHRGHAMKVRVRLSDGTYPFLDPIESANGKLKPFYAIVDGKPEHHPEGNYFLRYAKNGKRVWERVGNDAQLALTAKQKREKTLEAKAAGIEVVEDRRSPGSRPR